MSNLNPSFQPSKKQEFSVEELTSGVSSGSVVHLTQCITLIESDVVQDAAKAHQVLENLMPGTKPAMRIGITGVPGVGKSTFIEALGNLFVDKGLRIAVLAIDPSSKVSGGSILGDKTRMEELSLRDGVFIRPSPAAGALGGVANATHDAILLCEAAGFDVVFVETVGVGQSETEVADMVDLFLLLMLAGAGDELQGIKRGIMEMANMLVINKAEEQNMDNAIQAMAKYQSALHLMPPSPSTWTATVQMCSSLNGTGLHEISNTVESFFNHVTENGYREKLRQSRSVNRFDENLKSMLLASVMIQESVKLAIEDNRGLVSKGVKSPYAAAIEVVNSVTSS